MLFASYSDFRAKFQSLYDGDDISAADVSAGVLDLIISAGEQRIYRNLRTSAQETALSITCTGNAAPLPADFLELKGSPYVGPGRATASYMPQQQLQDGVNTNQNTVSAYPTFFTYVSDALVFYPPQPDGTVITGTYYKRFPDISTGLNALFTRHPDVFLYAALSESAPFLGEQSRLPIWEQKYSSLVQEANEQERRRITRGSKLQTRVG